MGMLEWVNLVLALAIFVAAACAVDKIQKATAHTVRAAVLLVLIGSLGELLAPMFKEAMRQAIDTCLLGGIAAFLFADRRGPFAPPRRDEPDAAHVIRQHRLAIAAQRASAVISAATVAILVMVWAGQVHAQEVKRPDGVVFDCKELAEIIADFADFRDTGADAERVIELVNRWVPDAKPERAEVMAREIRRLWEEKLSKRDAGAELYKRCKGQHGDMGRSA